jgi:HD-GYP domain-containing protein (c-di-GMP phosphodiesterase class II)
VAVGQRLGISGQRLELLRYAALLHDVGKLAVPEAILNKTGELEPGERMVLDRHVTIGVELLEGIDILAPTIPFIRYHQERWDGQRERDGVRHPGYFGLAGEDIPLEARIIAAVAAWDAMTSDRPYRRALSHHQARAELERGAGHQFDPTVVRALKDVLDAGDPRDSGSRAPVLGGLAAG